MTVGMLKILLAPAVAGKRSELSPAAGQMSMRPFAGGFGYVDGRAAGVLSYKS
jgi:hypothetical protein